MSLLSFLAWIVHTSLLCLGLYYAMLYGSFNFYKVVDKKVVNRHHVQNCTVISIFQLEDTRT